MTGCHCFMAPKTHDYHQRAVLSVQEVLVIEKPCLLGKRLRPCWFSPAGCVGSCGLLLSSSLSLSLSLRGRGTAVTFFPLTPLFPEILPAQQAIPMIDSDLSLQASLSFQKDWEAPWLGRRMGVRGEMLAPQQVFLRSKHFLFIYLFIYFWLCWVFVSVRGLSLVVANGGHSSSRCTGLSL